MNRFYEMVEGNQNDVIGEAEAGGIQTRKLSFTYDGGRVFNYSDIAVPDGRKVVLMGENGSGKSTLLFLLSGLLKPVAGSVRGTANVTALLQQEDKLGETCAMLLQEISRKKPVDDALFDSISKAFKIDYLNQSFDDLSGGQKKNSCLLWLWLPRIGSVFWMSLPMHWMWRQLRCWLSGCGNVIRRFLLFPTMIEY